MMIPTYIDEKKKWYIQSKGYFLLVSFHSLQEAIEYIRGLKIPVNVWR